MSESIGNPERSPTVPGSVDDHGNSCAPRRPSLAAALCPLSGGPWFWILVTLLFAGCVGIVVLLVRAFST